MAGLRRRALDATVYRHLLISCRPLAERTEEAPPTVAGLEVAFLERERIDDYAELRPDSAPAETRRRFDAGHRCMVGRLDGRILHARWISNELLESAYLGLAFELPRTSAYVYDTFTAASARRRGISVAASAFYREVLREEGMERALGSLWPGNRPARGMLERAGQELVGAVGAVRVGPARFAVRRRMPAGYLGQARRFEPAAVKR